MSKKNTEKIEKTECQELKKIISFLKIMGKITDNDIEKARQAINLFNSEPTNPISE